ncbi:MAG: hypothetical protein KAF27_07050 [Porphyrobacter sp.]|nr:hypothetical protein [Porphyrobacter sp.]
MVDEATERESAANGEAGGGEQHSRRRRRVRVRRPPKSRWPLRIALALLLAVTLCGGIWLAISLPV